MGNKSRLTQKVNDSVPSTPMAGYSSIYPKIVAGVVKYYRLDDQGNEQALVPGPEFFFELGDVPNNYTGFGNYYVRVKADESGLEFLPAPPTGAENFSELNDVPNTYVGAGGFFVMVKATEDGLEFVDIDSDDIPQGAVNLFMTSGEKTKLANLQEGFKGYFADEAALTAAHPVGQNGWYAMLGSTDTLWAWDGDTSDWVDTDTNSMGDMLKSVYDPQNIAADAFDRANHTGTQLAATISDFAATVRGTLMTGISFATSTAVTAADSILVAMGKLQAQINSFAAKIISKAYGMPKVTFVSNTTVTLDATNGTFFECATVGHNISFNTPTNFPNDVDTIVQFQILLIAQAPGGYTVTFPSANGWVNMDGSENKTMPAVGKRLLLSGIKNGSNYVIVKAEQK